MKLRFFAVPVDGGEVEEELNRYLATNRIATVDRVLVPSGGESFWAVAVATVDGYPSTKTLPRASRVDYKEILSEGEFAVFARLRDLRKSLAEKEGVPVYTLFTNEHLAKMVQEQMTSKTALETLPGVGTGRIEKYAEPFLEIVRQAARATARDSGAEAHEANRAQD